MLTVELKIHHGGNMTLGMNIPRLYQALAIDNIPTPRPVHSLENV